MLERVAGFDLDEGNRLKLTRHGVSIGEIEEIFHGEVWIFPDVFRMRGGERWIRPISARYMHAKEIRHFQAEVAHRRD
ncbi:MAG: hypothetical protein KBE42_08830 [Steroidobacteraceae bacterium]|nr:hypothetical protein [Steroidobacteraceae bacterium]